jgi:hypothetical protein
MTIGGGWDTTMVLVNMTPQTINFRQYFFDQSGVPMQVTFRSISQGVITTTAALMGTLPPNQSFNFLLLDQGQPLQVGWSAIENDTTNTILGGFAIFHQTGMAGASFEALVPLSSSRDYKFYMPFDNRPVTVGGQYFETGIAIVNPATTATTITVTFRDTVGNILATRTRTLLPGQQITSEVSKDVSETKGFAGVLYVTGTTMNLSALGFRFHPLGAFATIPIMNWSGMFP